MLVRFIRADDIDQVLLINPEHVAIVELATDYFQSESPVTKIELRSGTTRNVRGSMEEVGTKLGVGATE